MNDTMERIHKVANERHHLWSKAGKGGLNPTQTRRLQEIANELATLWDSYRREIAGDTRVPHSGYIKDRRSA